MSAGTVILNCARMDPCVESVAYIARLRLCVCRGGYELRLANVSEELGLVIELAGLSECLGVEMRRQVEHREKPGRVEEEGDLPDPAA